MWFPALIRSGGSFFSPSAEFIFIKIHLAPLSVIIIQQRRNLMRPAIAFCALFSLLTCCTFPAGNAPPLRITVHTSAKSTFIWPVLPSHICYTFCSGRQYIVCFTKEAAFIVGYQNWWRILSLLITKGILHNLLTATHTDTAWAILFLPSLKQMGLLQYPR